MVGRGLKDLYAAATKNGLPVVFYRLPGAQKPHLLVQQNPKLNVLATGEDAIGNDGFVVSPWTVDNGNPAVLIAPDYSYEGWEPDFDIPWLGEGLGQNDNGFVVPDDIHSSFDAYQIQIEQIQQAIANGRIEKAILSRIIGAEFDEVIDPVQAFVNASTRYPLAFCYLFFLPGIGIWMGASPELLINAKGEIVNTVSLAGTQPVNGHPINEIVWGKKEQHEQQVVTDYINNQLQTYCTDVSYTGPSTVKAANLFHLRTDFSATLAGEDHLDTLKRLVASLHPTPAISGAPKQAAIELIGEVEKHSRAYYAGYLGITSANGDTQLFVNLRCMNLIANMALLYVGGGITAGSNAESEWQETIAKANTLLNVLQ